MAVPTFAQLQSSPGNSLAIMVSGQNPDGTTYEQPVTVGSVNPANILSGFLTFAATQTATNIISVPAGRVWTGTVTITCAVQNAGANAVTGQATGVVAVSGVGVTPATGNYFRCDALAGANVAAGTVGDSGNNSFTSPFILSAPVGNIVSMTLTVTIAGSGGQVSCSAIGTLQ